MPGSAFDPCLPSTSTQLNNESDIIWEETDVYLGPHVILDQIPKFSEQGRPCIKFEKPLTPVETFNKFFPETVYKIVAEQTNIYANQCVDVTFDIPK